MSELKDQVREFVKFDEDNYVMSNMGARGAKKEHDRLSPLLELLPEIVRALEYYDKQCNGGFKERFPHHVTMHNAAKQTLAKIKKAVGGGMKIEDKFYPTIGITSHGTIREDANGYYWTIETHIAGPDDMTKTKSKSFFKKSDCTMDMLSQFHSTVETQVRELCK